MAVSKSIRKSRDEKVPTTDAVSNIARASVRFCPSGEGDMAPYLEDIAGALKRDGYEGVVSLESGYRPENGTFEDGYRECLPVFKQLFGD